LDLRKSTGHSEITGHDAAYFIVVLISQQYGKKEIMPDGEILNMVKLILIWFSEI
jgi:hypothetical protein